MRRSITSYVHSLSIIKRETISIRERYRSPITPDSLSPHIAHLLAQSILKQSRARSFASVNPNRKRKNVPAMMNRSPFLRFTTLSSNRSLRLELIRECTYVRERWSIIAKSNNDEKRGGYIRGKRSREICGKTVKNVLIERNDDEKDNEDDDSRWRPSIEVSSLLPTYNTYIQTTICIVRMYEWGCKFHGREKWER